MKKAFSKLIIPFCISISMLLPVNNITINTSIEDKPIDAVLLSALPEIILYSNGGPGGIGQF